MRELTYTRQQCHQLRHCGLILGSNTGLEYTSCLLQRQQPCPVHPLTHIHKNGTSTTPQSNFILPLHQAVPPSTKLPPSLQASSTLSSLIHSGTYYLPYLPHTNPHQTAKTNKQTNLPAPTSTCPPAPASADGSSRESARPSAASVGSPVNMQRPTAAGSSSRTIRARLARRTSFWTAGLSSLWTCSEGVLSVSFESAGGLVGF
ncbi:hypothetical protein B0T19DRAFT_65194 [Cercophora scortea]|uniref:Uncharacterized protein n=1 Tax=Cercophora scortea TaxID=314031 RepID=A0AAE0J5E2_9PEZI|nr:hypothetical protein B0T19DRAFT_65194 [Cercophora scortea]